MAEEQDPKRNGDEQERSGTKRPRGIGGVILILLLLLALLVMISNSGKEQDKSAYDFYIHLFNGRVANTTLSDGRVVADIERASEAGNNKKERISVVLSDRLREDWGPIVEDLLPRKLDTEAYVGGGGAERFLADFDAGEIFVERVFAISELPEQKKMRFPFIGNTLKKIFFSEPISTKTPKNWLESIVLACACAMKYLTDGFAKRNTLIMSYNSCTKPISIQSFTKDMRMR